MQKYEKKREISKITCPGVIISNVIISFLCSQTSKVKLIGIIAGEIINYLSLDKLLVLRRCWWSVWSNLLLLSSWESLDMDTTPSCYTLQTSVNWRFQNRNAPGNFLLLLSKSFQFLVIVSVGQFWRNSTNQYLLSELHLSFFFF